MPKQNYDQSEYQELASKYRPLLVLYAEIPSGSVRTAHPSWRAGGPPLTHDYHPRDIRLVLENAAIMGDKEEPGDWEIMLEKMEAAGQKRIDGVVGESLLKSLTDIYHEHSLHERLDQKDVFIETEEIPRIICSEALV